jgi:hypothetical protein
VCGLEIEAEPSQLDAKPYMSCTIILGPEVSRIQMMTLFGSPELNQRLQEGPGQDEK